MHAKHSIKQGDRLPNFAMTLTHGDEPIDNLALATQIKFFMRRIDVPTETNKVNGSAVSVVNAGAAEVEYVWGATDTDTPGFYSVEVEVTYSTLKETFPNKGQTIIEIKSDLG